MTLSFNKYQGTGNDFIVIDNRENLFSMTISLIKELCNRKLGIGADGVIVIHSHSKTDYYMEYFNADGSQSLCGNGSMCGFVFAKSLGIVQDSAIFSTTDGMHHIKEKNDMIYFQLADVAKVLQKKNNEWYINTGSPHHICRVENVDNINVLKEGSKIRYSAEYHDQNGANVNFIQLLKNKIKIRTYERGVENETLSCGTGAIAAALLASQFNYLSPVNIETLGGVLTVHFEKKEEKFTNIWLSGKVKRVFEGKISI